MGINLQHIGLVSALLVGVVLVFAVAVILRRSSRRLRERVWFDVEELKRRTDAGEDVLVMDVRTAEDFVGEQGHLAFACNLPLEELNDRLDTLGGNPQRTIAIVCRTDRRSAKAADLLVKKGFGDVHVVRGGMTAWLARGWPTAEDA